MKINYSRCFYLFFLLAFSIQRQSLAVPTAAAKAAAREAELIQIFTQVQSLNKAEKFDQAQALLQVKLKVMRAAPQQKVLKIAMADTHYAWAGSLVEKSRYEEAIRHYQAAYNIDKLLRPWDAGAILSEIAGAYDSLSQYEIALTYYQQVLAITRRTKDRRGEAGTLNNIGRAYNSLSQYEKALSYYQQALPIARQVKDKAGEAITTNNIGRAYNSLSQYEKALTYYQQALVIVRQAKDGRTEGVILNSIGLAYDSLSQYTKALSYYQKALVIRHQVKDRAGEGTTLNNIGLAYNSLSQYEKALTYYQQALAIRRQVKDENGEGTTLNNIGGAYHSLSQYEEALSYYRQALAILRRVKDRRTEGTTLNNIGFSYDSLSQYEKSLSYYQQALVIARQVKDRRGEGITLNNLMLVFDSLKNPATAIFYGKQSVNVYQTIRADIKTLDKASQQSFLSSNQDTYRKLADLLIEQGRLPEAEQVLQLLKQDEFFDFVRRDATRAGVSGNIALTPAEAESVKKYDVIANDATKIGTRMTQLEGRALTATEKIEYSNLQKQQTTINERWTIFTRELKVALDDGKRDKPIEVNEGLQRKLTALEKQGIKAAVVYTVVSTDNYNAILLTAHTRQAFRTDTKAAVVNKQVSSLRQKLKTDSFDPVPDAKALYKTVFCDGQLETALQGADIQVVLWFLDGSLRYVPLATLHDGKNYLVENPRLNVVLTPESIANDWSVPNLGGKVLALGTSLAHDVTLPDADGLPGKTLHFDGLDSVPAELRGIVEDKENKGAGTLPGQILLDPKFNQVALQEALRLGYSTVHIASHFELESGDETRSFLLMGDGKPMKLSDWNTQMNLNNVDLLTLSACETGVSATTKNSGATERNGAEVDSLGELAQRRGAGAVISSLWSVSDSSTSELMQNFYRLRQGKSLSKGEALRQAQLMLLYGEVQGAPSQDERNSTLHRSDNNSFTPSTPFIRDGEKPFAHPYYWAPFFLTGNWR